MSEQLRTAIAKAEQRGLTRYQIAKAAEVNQAQLSRLMSGAAVPKLDTAQRIAAAAGYRLVLERDR